MSYKFARVWHWLFNSDWTWLNKIWKTYGSCIKFPTVIQVNLYFSNVTGHNPWTSRKTCGASTKHPVVRRGKAKTCSFFCGLFPVAWRPWSILQRLGVVCQPKKKHHPKVEKTNNNQKQTPFVNRFYCFLLFFGGGRWGWYHFPHFLNHNLQEKTTKLYGNDASSRPWGATVRDSWLRSPRVALCFKDQVRVVGRGSWWGGGRNRHRGERQLGVEMWWIYGYKFCTHFFRPEKIDVNVGYIIFIWSYHPGKIFGEGPFCVKLKRVKKCGQNVAMPRVLRQHLYQTNKGDKITKMVGAFGRSMESPEMKIHDDTCLKIVSPKTFEIRIPWVCYSNSLFLHLFLGNFCRSSHHLILRRRTGDRPSSRTMSDVRIDRNSMNGIS